MKYSSYLFLSQVDKNYLVELYKRFNGDGDAIAHSLYLTYNKFISRELFDYLRVFYGCTFKNLK